MIVIIDYGVGNLASVKNALDKLGLNSKISNNPKDIKNARILILPGVGAAGQVMKNLEKNNLGEMIRAEIKKGKPTLGICLGMQLFFEKSEEGNVKCLGIFKGQVKKFRNETKVPQVGWNNVNFPKGNNIFKGIKNNSYFYFVNSYYCQPSDKSINVGITNYGENFSSIVLKDNIVGVQFHPEKSGPVGFKLLDNFVKGEKV